jgi:hypothetical protein
MNLNFTPPVIFQAIIGILSSLSVVAALASFVLAGLRLRAEGGVNYDAGGGFFKWLLWGAVFLTLPGIVGWLQSEGVPLNSVVTGSIPTSYGNQIQQIASDLVNNVIIPYIVPVLAATLVVKAILDTAEGNSPLPSTIAALFLLGVQGFFNLAATWNDGSNLATVDLLEQMFVYFATVVCPIVGALSVGGAVLSYIRNRPWAPLVFTGFAFLCVPGLWALVKTMAGITLPGTVPGF